MNKNIYISTISEKKCFCFVLLVNNIHITLHVPGQQTDMYQIVNNKCLTLQVPGQQTGRCVW